LRPGRRRISIRAAQLGFARHRELRAPYRLAVTIAFLSWLSLGFLAEPNRAHAAPCNVNQQIFVRSVSDRDRTNGTSNKILTSGNLDNGCDAIKVGTAHMERENYGQPGWGDWVEIGFYKDIGQNGTARLRLFTEWGTNFNFSQLNFYAGSGLSNDTYTDYRVANQPGNSDWDMNVDYLDGQGWRTKDTAHMTWGHGVALGETERWGSDTNMAQTQNSLDYHNDNDNWVSWPGQNCVYDNSTGWSWNRTSDDSYDIVSNQLNC
jgi:hypothetical protein